jgi:hypothetical protein
MLLPLRKLSCLHLVAALAALTVSACAEKPAPDPFSAQSTVRGDTLIVRSSGAGLWGPAHTPPIERKISGTSPEQPFGLLDMLAATPDGGVVVLDRESVDGAALYLFDSTGNFVRQVGRAGSGPGEHSRNLHVSGMLSVSSLGTIHVLEPSPDRVLIYDRLGQHVRTVTVGTRSRRAVLVATHDGGSCVSDNEVPQRTVGRAPIRCLDSLGTVIDSIADIEPWQWDPDAWSEGTGSTWTVTRDRRVIHSRHDRLGFLLMQRVTPTQPDWSVLRAAELDAHPVPRSRGELEEERRFAAYFAQASRSAPRSVALEKPLSGALSTDLDGRIWISRRAPGQVIAPEMKYWGMMVNGTRRELTTSYAEPTHAVVFDSLGTLLGELQFPIRTRVSAVGSTIWATQVDESGESHLVKYRLTTPDR